MLERARQILDSLRYKDNDAIDDELRELLSIFKDIEHRAERKSARKKVKRVKEVIFKASEILDDLK